MHMRRSDGAVAILERMECQISYLAFLRSMSAMARCELDLGRTWPNLQARAVNNCCDGVDVARIYRVWYVVNIHSCNSHILALSQVALLDQVGLHSSEDNCNCC